MCYSDALVQLGRYRFLQLNVITIGASSGTYLRLSIGDTKNAVCEVSYALDSQTWHFSCRPFKIVLPLSVTMFCIVTDNAKHANSRSVQPVARG